MEADTSDAEVVEERYGSLDGRRCAVPLPINDASLTNTFADSLTGQHHLHLIAWLGIVSNTSLPGDSHLPFLRPPTDSELSSWPSYYAQSRAHTQIYFLTSEARDKWFPTVSDARLAQPVLTFMRADFLLHDEEVKQLMLPPSQRSAKKRKRQTHPERWREWATRWLGEPGTKLQPLKQRSIVIINTGAHWTAHGAMGGGDRSEEVERLFRAYEGVAEEVVAFFRPWAWKVHLIYRTTSPGHPACTERLPTRLPSLPSPLSAKEEPWSLYGWELFPRLDAVWKRKVEELEAEVGLGRSRGRIRDGWKVDLMDVREQALARGDAHSGPFKGDCLHVCRSPTSRRLTEEADVDARAVVRRSDTPRVDKRSQQPLARLIVDRRLLVDAWHAEL